MKKKIISLLLAFSILASVFVVLPAVGASAATNVTSVLDDGEKNASVVTIKTGADGTNSAPVEIWNAEQLIDFAKRVSGDAALGYEANNRFSAILKADIDLNPGYSFKLDYNKKLVEVYKDGEHVNYVDPGYNNASKAGKWYAIDGTTEVAMPEGFKVWTPIGDGTVEGSYYGYFDGNACKVSGVYVIRSGYNVGFFGKIGSYFANNANTTGSYAATVKSFTVKNSLIVGKGNVGAVVGSSMLNNNNIACGDGCTISSHNAYKSYPKVYIDSLSNENSVVVSNITSGDSNVGGVIGNVDIIQHSHNGAKYKGVYEEATNFYNSGDVLSKGSNVGGVIGNNVRLPMSGFTNTGNVYGGSNVAGISARISEFINTKLYNYGDVTGTGENVGGITAFTYRAVTTAFNAGNITGSTKVAGIAAWVEDGTGFTETANVGNITATSSSGVAGGIIGDFKAAGKEIKNSYNAGVIDAACAAGITGTTKVTAAITNCHTTVGGDVKDLLTDANTAEKVRCSIVTAEDLANGSLALTLGTGFGQSVNMDYPVPAYTSSLAGTDVTLKDGILLNFYVDVSVNVNAGDAELVTKEDGKQYYKVTVAVDAKDMGEAQSVTVAGATYTSSVAEYAAGILAGEKYTAETKALVQAMLNYGAAAQNYFGKTDELVGTPVTDTSALAGAEVEAPTVTDANKQYIGASLILEGTMKLRFYFKGNSLAITVDGVAAEVVNGEEYCYVDVAVTPDSIDELFEVAAGDVSVKYGALNYLKNNASNEKLADMVASIYAYSVAAEAYVAAN